MPFIKMHIVQDDNTLLPVWINSDKLKLVMPMTPTKAEPGSAAILFEDGDPEEDAMTVMETFEEIGAQLPKPKPAYSLVNDTIPKTAATPEPKPAAPKLVSPIPAKE